MRERTIDRVNNLRYRLGLKAIKMRGRTIEQLVIDNRSWIPEVDFEMITKSPNPAKTFRKWLAWQYV